jgi:hypothetical protein
MRVMLSCPYSLSVFGGVQGQVLLLAKALRRRGVDARVIAPCDGPPPEPGITTVGPTTRVPSNGSVAPIATGRAVAHRTLEAIRSFSPDVLHLHEPFTPGSNHAALMGTGVPAAIASSSTRPKDSPSSDGKHATVAPCRRDRFSSSPTAPSQSTQGAARDRSAAVSGPSPTTHNAASRSSPSYAASSVSSPLRRS